MSATAVPTDAALTHAHLTVQLLEGVMGGYQAAGQSAAQAEQRARRAMDVCAQIAQGLVRHNDSLPGSAPEARLQGVGRLFAQALRGLMGQGKTADEALRATQAQRDRLFRTASTVVAALPANPTMTPTDPSVGLSLTVGLLSGVFDGYLRRSMPVQEALHEASKTSELCQRMANTLVAMDLAQADPDPTQARLAGVRQLLSQAVAGLVARGEEGPAALAAAGHHRERFFVMAHQVVRQLSEPSPPGLAERLTARREAQRPPQAPTPPSSSWTLS